MATERLRVLVVSLGRRGGVTTYGRMMAGGLAEHWDVAAVYSSYADDARQWDASEFPHLGVETFSGIASMAVSFLSWRRFARIARFAKEFAPHVIYYPGGHAWKPVLDLILPRNALTVLTIHDPELHHGEDSLAHRVFNASNRAHVDGFVLLNRAQSTPYATRYGIEPSRIAVIPHGIFDEELQARRAPEQVPSIAHLAPLVGRFLLFAGRIQRYKGIDVLVDAYGRVDPACRLPLVIAGSGEFSAQEKAGIEAGGSDVSVVNQWLSSVEIATLVDAARFVVLPYTSATQSGVIPLASAFGTPAIASDTGGLAEQVRDGVTGLLVPPNDPAALAGAIELACRMPQQRYTAMSQACREFARTEWDWSVLAGSLVDFFSSLSRSSGASGRPAASDID